MQLCCKLKPTDYEDIYNKYLDYASKNITQPVLKRGLDYNGFYNLALEYKKLAEEKTNFKYDLSVYFYGLVCHAIIETLNGQNKEQELLKLLKLRGYDAHKEEGFKDTRYGVDVAVKGINEDFYIQIKPITFFMSKKLDTQKDRINCCCKRNEMLEIEKIDTYYAIYDLTDGILRWVGKDGNNVLFKVNDLFEYDENTLIVKPIPKNRIKLDFLT